MPIERRMSRNERLFVEDFVHLAERASTFVENPVPLELLLMALDNINTVLEIFPLLAMATSNFNISSAISYIHQVITNYSANLREIKLQALQNHLREIQIENERLGIILLPEQIVRFILVKFAYRYFKRFEHSLRVIRYDGMDTIAIQMLAKDLAEILVSQLSKQDVPTPAHLYGSFMWAHNQFFNTVKVRGLSEALFGTRVFVDDAGQKINEFNLHKLSIPIFMLDGRLWARTKQVQESSALFVRKSWTQWFLRKSVEQFCLKLARLPFDFEVISVKDLSVDELERDFTDVTELFGNRQTVDYFLDQRDYDGEDYYDDDHMIESHIDELNEHDRRGEAIRFQRANQAPGGHSDSDAIGSGPGSGGSGPGSGQHGFGQGQDRKASNKGKAAGVPITKFQDGGNENPKEKRSDQPQILKVSTQTPLNGKDVLFIMTKISQSIQKESKEWNNQLRKSTIEFVQKQEKQGRKFTGKELASAWIAYSFINFFLLPEVAALSGAFIISSTFMTSTALVALSPIYTGILLPVILIGGTGVIGYSIQYLIGKYAESKGNLNIISKQVNQDALKIIKESLKVNDSAANIDQILHDIELTTKFKE